LPNDGVPLEKTVVTQPEPEHRFFYEARRRVIFIVEATHRIDEPGTNPLLRAGQRFRDNCVNKQRPFLKRGADSRRKNALLHHSITIKEELMLRGIENPAWYEPGSKSPRVEPITHTAKAFSANQARGRNRTRRTAHPVPAICAKGDQRRARQKSGPRCRFILAFL